MIVQRIEKIKSQLTEMRDLVQSQTDEDNREAELEENEVNTLREAKILQDSPRGYRKKYSHILFAQNSDEGMRFNHDLSPRS